MVKKAPLPGLRTGLEIEPSVPRFQEQLFQVSRRGVRGVQVGQGTGLGGRPPAVISGSCDAHFCGWIVLSYLLQLPVPQENRLLALPHHLPETSPS